MGHLFFSDFLSVVSGWCSVLTSRSGETESGSGLVRHVVGALYARGNQTRRCGIFLCDCLVYGIYTLIPRAWPIGHFFFSDFLSVVLAWCSMFISRSCETESGSGLFRHVVGAPYARGYRTRRCARCKKADALTPLVKCAFTVPGWYGAARSVPWHHVQKR